MAKTSSTRWRKSRFNPGRLKNSPSKLTLMRTGRLKSPLPPLKDHVRGIMKSQHINVNRLSKLMNVTQPTASYLLNRNDWYVSELKLAGDLLKVNLFEFFTPEIIAQNTAMKARIAELEEEMKLVKHENTLLKEIIGKK